MPATSAKAIAKKTKNHGAWATNLRMEARLKTPKFAKPIAKMVEKRVQQHKAEAKENHDKLLKRWKKLINDKDNELEHLRGRSNKYMREAAAARGKAAQRETMWTRLVARYTKKSKDLSLSEHRLDRTQKQLRASRAAEKRLWTRLVDYY